MKNKSFKYPFPTLADKMFDKNKDGKLDTFETAFRDMYLDEMSRKADEYSKNAGTSSRHKPNNNVKFTSESDNNKPPESGKSVEKLNQTLWLINTVLIGGIAVAVFFDIPEITKVLILAAAFALSLCILFWRS